MSGSETSRRFGLDILRAAAISFVLSSHLLNGLDWLGFYGVEIFFVLSGFLIGGILIRMTDEAGQFGRQELSEFLRRRWYRTLPNYYLFLTLFVVIQSFHPIDGKVSFEQLLQYLFFFQSFAWPRPSFYGVSWSLCVEEWFYLLTAISLFGSMALIHLPRFKITTCFLIVGISYTSIPLSLRLFVLPDGPVDTMRLIVVYRLDAIMFGLMMALCKARAPRLWVWHRGAALASLILLLLTHLILDPSTSVGYAILLSAVPFSLSLLLPLFDGLRARKGLIASAITSISLWSYSMYLCHMLIYQGLKPLVGYDSLTSLEKVVFKSVSLGLIVLFSALNYRYFELPLTRLRDRQRSLSRSM
jgi:peptidoglycan/LPS O-acetylase OafA/YrhL